jgi:hypothetical protein
VKYHGETHLNKEYALEKWKTEMKNRSCWGFGTSGGDGQMERAQVNKVDVFYILLWKSMKLDEITLSRGKTVSENNEGDEANQGTL